MAKIVKVTVGLTISGGRITRSYPPEYDSKKIEVLCYETFGDLPTVISRGDNKEYCIGVVADSDLASFTASADIVELDRATADTLGNALRPAIETITDEAAVRGVCAKAANATALTQSEKDAINPSHSTKGINRSNGFADLLTGCILKVG